MRKTKVLITQVFFSSSIILLSTSFLSAQHFEYPAHFNSGLFHYTGSTAYNTTFINLSDPDSKNNVYSGYANNLTGKYNGFSYGGSFSIQRVTKPKILYGVNIGWESLQSKIKVNGVWDAPDYLAMRPAKGSAYLRNGFINSYWYTGYRFKINNPVLKNILFDITGGLELALPTSAKQTGKAIITGTDTTVTTNHGETNSPFDIRLRTQLTGWYKKWGLNIGYSYGLQNYYSGWTGGSANATPRYLRIELSYKIK